MRHQTVVLRVMTINVRHDRDQWEKRFPLLAAEIARLKPDVIGLQEVEIVRSQSQVLKRLIEAQTRANPLRYTIYEKLKFGKSAARGEGIAIFSRLPLREKRAFDLGYDRPLLYARVDLGGGLMADLYNTHLHEHDTDDARLGQVQRALGFLSRNELKYPRFFVGDLNADENSTPIAYLVRRGYFDTYQRAPKRQPEPNPYTSWHNTKQSPTQPPNQRIDFILGQLPPNPGLTMVVTDSQVCFKSYDAAGRFPSDHLGVITTLMITTR